jgi:hypothetical protein
VATSSKVSHEKLVVMFAVDIEYEKGERENQKEAMVPEAVKIYFTCGSRDFPLLLSIGLPAESQVPPIRTEQAACWGSRVTINRKDSSSHEVRENQRLQSFVMLVVMRQVYITNQTPRRILCCAESQQRGRAPGRRYCCVTTYDRSVNCRA